MFWVEKKKMFELTETYIKNQIADTPIIFKRGVNLYHHGSSILSEGDNENGSFSYEVDGNYADYVTQVILDTERVRTSCDCPYPGFGCKHTVAVLLDIRDRLERSKMAAPLESRQTQSAHRAGEPYRPEKPVYQCG
jgi:uncharacterized Zn finger protein